MDTRTFRATASQHAARRRVRRTAATRLPYCSTNGCTTLLEVDAARRSATCPVCGSRRRLS